MTNEEKAREIQANDVCCVWNGGCPNVRNGAMKMAQWKDEQLGWHDAKKEQPHMDEEVIALTNILNGKELSTPRMICFAHIVDKNICVDYDGWNIPGVAYWMYYKEPK